MKILNNAYGTWTLFKRETKRFLKVYMQTLLGPVASGVIYFAVFGVSIYTLLPETESSKYLIFIVPGLISMGIINSAFQNPSSSMIIMKYQGLISDLLTIPLKRYEIFLAFISSAVLRAFIVGGMTLITALFFVPMPFYSVGMIFLASLLMALFFSFTGFLLGLWANEFDKSAFVSTFVLSPLIMLGGAFYSISRLPAPFDTLSQFNPIVYLIDLLRYGFTGTAEFSLALSLAVSIALTAIFGIWSYTLLKRGYHLEN